MTSEDDGQPGTTAHAHGVTPGLKQDYATRTASRQAAFVLPYLRQGMDLLDAGCGPGTITVGLAQAVAPGHVTGIDHDLEHVRAASNLAEARGLANVTFRSGDALSLPFEGGTFDAAFENDLLTHLPQDAVRVAREVYRVLKPGGFFAARDVDAEAIVWGHQTPAIQALDRLMMAWQRSRGSDITLGKRLPAILREAGFGSTIKSVSADSKGDLEAVRSHAKITVFLLDGPLGRDAVERGWADEATIERLKEGIQAWAEHPDAFFANVHVEVIGWKPV
ncbi:MAG: methyltransferase domain-containing protein [Anaerolineae bacterium]|jgi:ubiquinone/menaquinone biosynthesis C-methylase UbiE